MLKEAINRILELSAPHIVEFESGRYTDKELEYLPREHVARPLYVHSLSAIVDYITSGVDHAARQHDRRFVIHVEDYNAVSLYHELNSDKVRECVLQARFEAPTFPFGRFLDVENFMINLQSSFVPSANVKALVKLVGNITNGNEIKLADDGVTQKATVKTGISLCGQVDIPSPVQLAPFRTFSEIPQPESPFVFRVHGGVDVAAALFEASGDAWKHAALVEMRDYFRNELPEQHREQVIILA